MDKGSQVNKSQGSQMHKLSQLNQESWVSIDQGDSAEQGVMDLKWTKGLS